MCFIKSLLCCEENAHNNPISTSNFVVIKRPPCSHVLWKKMAPVTTTINTAYIIIGINLYNTISISKNIYLEFFGCGCCCGGGGVTNSTSTDPACIFIVWIRSLPTPTEPTEQPAPQPPIIVYHELVLILRIDIQAEKLNSPFCKTGAVRTSGLAVPRAGESNLRLLFFYDLVSVSGVISVRQCTAARGVRTRGQPLTNTLPPRRRADRT